MADFVITAANVQFAGKPATIVAGETLVAGDFIYKKTSDGRGWKAQCDGTAEEGTLIGMCVNGASAGQPVGYVTSGDITTGAAFTSAGKLIVLSAALGKCAPHADLVATNKLVIIGWSISATAFKMQISNTGQAVP